MLVGGPNNDRRNQISRWYRVGGAIQGGWRVQRAGRGSRRWAGRFWKVGSAMGSIFKVQHQKFPYRDCDRKVERLVVANEILHSVRCTEWIGGAISSASSGLRRIRVRG